MQNFVYELNNYIKTDATLLSAAGVSSIEPRPMGGYETDESPSILYWWYPSIKSPDQYWFRTDTVKYMILDSDFDRCLAIGNRIIDMLNVADNIQAHGASSFQNFVPKWSVLARAETLLPTQREGFYYFSITISTGYVPVA